MTGSDTTNRDTPAMYRNDPTETFDAHLFDPETVEEAGGGHRVRSNRPISSLCSRRTSTGEFVSIDPIEDEWMEIDICNICLNRADFSGGGSDE